MERVVAHAPGGVCVALQDDERAAGGAQVPYLHLAVVPARREHLGLVGVEVHVPSVGNRR